MGRWQDGANGRGLDRCEVGKNRGKKKDKDVVVVRAQTDTKKTD